MRIFAAATLVFIFALFQAGPLLAQTVLQGYKSDEQLQRGMLVALKDDDQTKVVAITEKNSDKLKGVIADAKDSPVTISDSSKQVFVATTGEYEVLVSTEHGPINPGDYISGSSLSGIGTKAGDSQALVIGRATGKFEGKGDSIGQTQAKSGGTVSFGRVKVDVGVSNNPYRKIPDKDKVPDALQKAANTVAEKDVSTLRIYLALVVMVITAAVAATTLFSGVRSTIISIGRNPLSKGLILRGLVQVLLVSLIIFITGLFGVYLLIKL